jgi:hypothetical protein
MNFVYEGNFLLPNRRGYAPEKRFGHGGDAICFNPVSSSLFVAGHRNGGPQVAEISIPDTLYDRAEVVTDFFPVANAFDKKQFGLNRIGGLALSADGVMLYSTWYRYYGVQSPSEIDDPTLSCMNLETRIMRALRHIGPKNMPPFNQKATSGYLFPGPGNLLVCGRGDGAGNASSPHGPAFFSFDPLTPDKADILRYISRANAPSNWSPCDRWTGAAYVDGKYLVVGSKDMLLSEPWYGEPDNKDGRVDPWNKSKGYHCESREVMLQVYDANGEHEVSWILPDFEPPADVRSLAFDPGTRRLYIWEHGPWKNEGNIYAGEEPRIHIYRIPEVTTTPTPDDNDDWNFGINVTLEIDGVKYAGRLREV